MLCWIEREHFLSARMQIQPPRILLFDSEGSSYRPPLQGLLRVEAVGKTVHFRGPYACAEVPAQVERRGVIFVPIEEFVLATENLVEDDQIVIEANLRRVRTNRRHLLLGPHGFVWIMFDDPATAPQSWEQVEEECFAEEDAIEEEGAIDEEHPIEKEDIIDANN